MVLAPSGPFYYLLVLFTLRYFVADLSRLRHPLVICVIIGLAGGIDDQLGFTGALHATFALAPFFLEGYYIREEFIHALRKIPVAIPILLLISVTAVCYAYPVSGYYMNYYSFYGISIRAGIASRLAFYCMGTVCILGLFRILPKRKCFLTIIGRNSMPVYIISTFLAPQLYYIIAPYLPLSEVNLVAGIYVTGFCLVLVLVSSRECFARLYKGVFQKVESVIFIK